MKKQLPLIILLIVIITGCNTESGILTCTSTTTQDENVSLNSEYIIYYENNYVTTLKTKEIITSKNQEDLETYKETLENAYQDYNKIDYYTNTISIEKNNLISSTIINYQKINTDKLIEIDSNNASLIKNSKIKIQDIKKMYQDNGCICK